MQPRPVRAVTKKQPKKILNVSVMNNVTYRTVGVVMQSNTENRTGRPNSREAFRNACITSCQKVREQVARVRQGLFAEWRDMLTTQERLLQLALNEAEALAWQTEVPHLVFPTLAEEKVHAAASWTVRQRVMNSGRRAAIAA